MIGFVHSKLSGPEVQKLLAEMDDLYGKYYIHKSSPPKGESDRLGNFLSFHGFKTELNEFLRKSNIEIPHPLDRLSWEDFEGVYCSIVGKCLLIYENNIVVPGFQTRQ